MSKEVDEEKEFNYEKGGEHGPDRWGEIHSEWSACKNGTMQSPIDLLNERVELQWKGGAGTILINGTKYVLQQCHWHSPSEHTIDGKRFALEAHMVHESHDGKVAVVGIVYKIGRPDSFLASISDHLRNISGSNERDATVGVIDPRAIKIGSSKYYRYIGSLTVPPCTENVTWTIVRKVRSVTREQVRLLRVAVHDESNTNARPLQPINMRSVKLYKPDEENENC
ncbi:alpha carbonic anhydrase 7 [Citrus sinensis]|uniref:Alpha carbonic anhydrase 7 n=1 Tax=Citrus sinensis TaxID=2711 RepID=A0ACB8KPS0_CITSI|nr:alpha carbonic anhydrase 7 [Citrus sinensis]